MLIYGQILVFISKKNSSLKMKKEINVNLHKLGLKCDCKAQSDIIRNRDKVCLNNDSYYFNEIYEAIKKWINYDI